MKKICIELLFAFLFLFFVSFTVTANDFKSMKNEIAGEYGENVLNEFQQYKKQVRDEFKIYKDIVNEEFSRYKKDISKQWVDIETSGVTRWVEYSPDYKTRKIVDFKEGIIEIDIIIRKDDQNIDQKIIENLEDLVTETSKTAFERDSFSKRVEERLVASVEEVKISDSIAEAPIVTDIVTGTANPDEKQIAEAVSSLKESGEVHVKPSKTSGEKVVGIIIKLPSERMLKKALQYVEAVKKYSGELDVDPKLVFAIMQTESSFNPMAKSYVPAYGLMQIVPTSAGKDASKVVYGKPVLLAPSFLYDTENNIQMGTAYLKVLTKRYLRNIKDEKSRIYCAIAAYNTGTGNVAKAFIGRARMSAAAPVINKMKPEEVYEILIEKLPYVETRNYMKKVTRRMEHYEEI